MTSENPPTQADKILAKAVRPCMTAKEAGQAATSIKRSLALIERRSAVRSKHKRAILQLLSWAKKAKKPKDRIRWVSQAQAMLRPLLVRGPGTRVLPPEKDPRLGKLFGTAANPDVDLRELERLAATGDELAAARLRRKLCRSGKHKLWPIPFPARGDDRRSCIHCEESFPATWQQNPDESLRELERLAAAGDTLAELRLLQARRRAGLLDPVLARGLEFLEDPDQRPMVTKPALCEPSVSMRQGRSTLLEEERKPGLFHKRVKNLGWLLRQHSKVNLHWPILFARSLPGGRCYLRIVYVSNPIARASQTGSIYSHDWEATFETTFESCQVTWEWIHRPIFWGRPIDWDGRRGIIPEVYGTSGRISRAREVEALPGLGEAWLPTHLTGPGLDEEIDYEHFPARIEPHVRRWVGGGHYAVPVANPPLE